MDVFRKVSPGDPVTMPASLYNELVDLVLTSRARSAGSVQGIGPSWNRAAAIVRCNNVTGNAYELGGAVGLTTPPFLPTDAGEAFFEQVIFNSAAPEAGLFGIAIEPIAAGFVGRICLAGAVIARITVDAGDTSGKYVEIDGGVLKLKSRGSARVLWRETGSGAKWAILLMASPSGLDDVAWKAATSGTEAGLYKAFSAEPENWILVKAATTGFCPSSGSSGGGCSDAGYDPNAGQSTAYTSWGPRGGFAAYFGDPDTATPPSAPPAGTWEDVSYPDIYNAAQFPCPDGAIRIRKFWRNEQCNWAAYGKLMPCP